MAHSLGRAAAQGLQLSRQLWGQAAELSVAQTERFILNLAVARYTLVRPKQLAAVLHHQSQPDMFRVTFHQHIHTYMCTQTQTHMHIYTQTHIPDT